MKTLSTEEILLAQVKMYLTLAKNLNSVYYFERAKTTLELYYAERENRTAEYKVA